MKTRIDAPSFGNFTALVLLLAALAPASGRAAGVVTSPTEASLRAALAGGGTINLAAVLSITNTTVMDGTGYAVTLSGSNVTQVFFVNTNVQFTLNNLTVANG